MTIAPELQLLEWRRTIAALYAEVRTREPEDAWNHWCAERRRLFLTHPQSPLPAGQRDDEHAPRYFPYDAAWRRRARVASAEEQRVTLPGSGAAHVDARRFAVAVIDGLPPLSLYWLDDYAGGVFLAFRDTQAGAATYGGGRYLLDTAKGADLGGRDDELLLDFNFAYQPSCSYDPRWECPLASRENALPVAVAAGERMR